MGRDDSRAKTRERPRSRERARERSKSKEKERRRSKERTERKVGFCCLKPLVSNKLTILNKFGKFMF